MAKAQITEEEIMHDISKEASGGKKNPNKPIGDNVAGHTVTTRLMIRKGKATKRAATLTKNPELPDGKIEFSITTEGIHDLEK